MLPPCQTPALTTLTSLMITATHKRATTHAASSCRIAGKASKVPSLVSPPTSLCHELLHCCAKLFRLSICLDGEMSSEGQSHNPIQWRGGIRNFFRPLKWQWGREAWRIDILDSAYFPWGQIRGAKMWFRGSEECHFAGQSDIQRRWVVSSFASAAVWSLTSWFITSQWNSSSSRAAELSEDIGRNEF